MDGWIYAWMDGWIDEVGRKGREGFWWKAKGGSGESWDAAKMHGRG